MKQKKHQSLILVGLHLFDTQLIVQGRDMPSVFSNSKAVQFLNQMMIIEIEPVAEGTIAEPKVAQTKGCQTKVAEPNYGPSAPHGFLTTGT